MHLADAFIQSDLQWIQSIHVCQHIHSIIIMFISSLVCVCVCVSVCSSGFLHCFRMGKSPSCGGFESLLCIDGTFGAFLYVCVCVCVRRGNDHLEEILNQTPERALWTSSLTETWAFTQTHTHTHTAVAVNNLRDLLPRGKNTHPHTYADW